MCATVINKVLCLFSECSLFKIANTAHHSYMLTKYVVYNNIPKITEYLDNKPNYFHLDNEKIS